jgi:hypothetical protein
LTWVRSTSTQGCSSRHNVRFNVGGHTTNNTGLYAPDGTLIEEHLVSMTIFGLLDLYSRSDEALLPPKGFSERASRAAGSELYCGGGF